MPFNFTECRDVLFTGVMKALRSRTNAINAIKRTGRGDLPITGVALDLAPWHGGAGLALRLSSDPNKEPERSSSVEWEHFNFVSKENCEALVAVGEYIQTAYKSDGDAGVLDMAHLVFLAGADALLDPEVAMFFRSFGINAPLITDRLGGHYFDYIVINPDGTIPANYCDLVVGMRATKRLLGQLL